MVEPPYILFDDARPGGRARLYRQPRRTIVATRLAEVVLALDDLRDAVRGGAHAAGYLAYEAGQALDPKLVADGRAGDGPLLWFGLFDGYEEPPIGSILPDPDAAFASAPRPRWDYADYQQAALQVRDALFAGDYYQANLTFGCDVAVHGDPLSLYARMRAGSRAGWGGVLNTGSRWLVSLSPEQFFTIRDGRIDARPMKGTAPRRASPAEDALEAQALAADPKQRAENLMIVDLLRNDLARLSLPGSVEVPELFAVEHYPTVHQMVSRVSGRLRPGLDAVAVLRAIFPCGSVTGAPKIAVIKALRDLEPEPRGAYTGSMGWIEPGSHGDAAFNVLIRTLEGEAGAGIARLGLGSGLVVDSEPRNEWAECLLKGKFVNQQAPAFDLIETMRFDPHEGIIELERHLDRMRGAAGNLDFHFDRHTARNELQAATFGRKEEAMVRLLLSPSGAMAIQLKAFDGPVTEPVSVALRPAPVRPDDVRVRYKTTDRQFYDSARIASGCWEVVFHDSQGRITEGSRTNVFVERDGLLVTPPLILGMIAGVLRSRLIEEGRAIEGELREDDLCGGFLIGNSARGLMKAVLA